MTTAKHQSHKWIDPHNPAPNPQHCDGADGMTDEEIAAYIRWVLDGRKEEKEKT